MTATKRDHNIMLRLTAGEYGTLSAVKPEAEDMAGFVRRVLLAAIDRQAKKCHVREVAAFVVAALSADLGFDDALSLFDDYFSSRPGGYDHGAHSE